MQTKSIRNLALGISVSRHCLHHFLIPPAAVTDSPPGKYLSKSRPADEPLALRNLRNIFVFPTDEFRGHNTDFEQKIF